MRGIRAAQRERQLNEKKLAEQKQKELEEKNAKEAAKARRLALYKRPSAVPSEDSFQGSFRSDKSSDTSHHYGHSLDDQPPLPSERAAPRLSDSSAPDAYQQYARLYQLQSGPKPFKAPPVEFNPGSPSDFVGLPTDSSSHGYDHEVEEGTPAMTAQLSASTHKSAAPDNPLIAQATALFVSRAKEILDQDGSPLLGFDLATSSEPPGVVITNIERISAASLSGPRIGDVITRIGEHRVSSTDQFYRLWHAISPRCETQGYHNNLISCLFTK